jgi:hypothetical protein
METSNHNEGRDSLNKPNLLFNFLAEKKSAPVLIGLGAFLFYKGGSINGGK